MQLSGFTVLSEQEIKQIHEATLDILENCGVKILSEKMLSFLENKGLDVDRDSRIVRFSRGSLEDALSTVPEQFDVFDRDGEFAFVLGDGVPRIAAGHNAVFWVDSDTGRTRDSTVADVEFASRICQHLECIDMIGIPVMPQDVPNPKATLLYAVKAVIENSTKPIFFSTDNCGVNRSCIELIRAGFSGDLKSQVYGITQLSPTSPLYWEQGVLDSIMDTVSTGVPIAILPEPIAGVSSPYTLAGLLTMNNAECISGLAIIELLNPGHKVMYANSWTTFDMLGGTALVGSVETTLCRIAGAQLARFYNVPSHTTAPNSDNHAHDEQNAWEKSFSTLCAVCAGNDLIVNCGMFATGMTFSHEQLLMDEAISAMAVRVRDGITVNPDTIAADLMKKIGPLGETYLTNEHTINWLHSREYMRTRLTVSGPRAVWEAEGCKDTYQLAREKVKEYINLRPKSLSSDRAARLSEIIEAFNK